MSNENFIRNVLGIKDPNIIIEDTTMQKINNKTYQVIIARLQTPPKTCQCGANRFVKNGHKTNWIKALPAMKHPVKIKLEKQNYRCKNCGKYQVANTDFVERFCQISKPVKTAIRVELFSKQTMKQIAKSTQVSTNTVLRVLKDSADKIKPNTDKLPEVLSVDEFKSMKKIAGKMSFIMINGETGQLIDVRSNRQLNSLKAYFMTYSKKALNSVKYFVTDMNAPYFQLAKTCFPNAQVVVDRFHIIQYINRALNNLRVNVMKSFKKSTPKYRQLKGMWRLLLKKETQLDFVHFKPRRSFKNANLTETEMVDRLLAISPILKKGYHFTQALLRAFDNRNAKAFFEILRNETELPETFWVLRKTFNRYQKGIELAFALPYSNGKIENRNLHIKVLKKNCYGFRNWKNFKTRIKLMSIKI